MTQIITATYENGVLKPEEKLDLAAGTKVRIFVALLEQNGGAPPALTELDNLCAAYPIDSGGFHLTREQLHERP